MDIIKRSVFVDCKGVLPLFEDFAAVLKQEYGLNAVFSLVPTPVGYIVTFTSEADVAECIDSGVVINGDVYEVSQVSSRTVNAVFFDMPAYVTDDALRAKLLAMNCSLRGDIVWRKRAGLYNGTRVVRLTLPDGVTSLPYGIRVPDVMGRGQFYRVKHEAQAKVCNKCFSSDHLYKQCPEFVCRKCNKQGHVIRMCPEWNQTPELPEEFPERIAAPEVPADAAYTSHDIPPLENTIAAANHDPAPDQSDHDTLGNALPDGAVREDGVLMADETFGDHSPKTSGKRALSSSDSDRVPHKKPGLPDRRQPSRVLGKTTLRVKQSTVASTQQHSGDTGPGTVPITDGS